MSHFKKAPRGSSARFNPQLPQGQPKKAGQVVLLGFHAVRARFRAAPETIHSLHIDTGRKDGRLKALLAEAAQAGIQAKAESPDQLERLSGGGRHQGVIALAEPRALVDDLGTLLEQLEALPVQKRLLLFLDGVTDPHNLGAILRTADAAGVAAVVAPRDHSAPLNDAVMRVSAGAADTTPYIQVTNLSRAIEAVQAANYQVIGLDGEASQSVYQSDLTGALVLVMGAEGTGMRRLVREHCDGLVALPLLGSVESLNVSVATGAVLYEAIRQRGLARQVG